MWGKIIQDLIDAGWSEAAIAKNIGVEQPTINRLKKGSQKSTAYEIGEKLKTLHVNVVQEISKRKKKTPNAA